MTSNELNDSYRMTGRILNIIYGFDSNLSNLRKQLMKRLDSIKISLKEAISKMKIPRRSGFESTPRRVVHSFPSSYCNITIKSLTGNFTL